MKTPTSEAGWAFALVADNMPNSLQVIGRHLLCGGRLSITLDKQDLNAIGRRADHLLDGSYVAKQIIIQAHEPCAYLMSKVRVFDKEKDLWHPLVEE